MRLTLDWVKNHQRAKLKSSFNISQNIAYDMKDWNKSFTKVNLTKNFNHF